MNARRIVLTLAAALLMDTATAAPAMAHVTDNNEYRVICLKDPYVTHLHTSQERHKMYASDFGGSHVKVKHVVNRRGLDSRYTQQWDKDRALCN